MVTPKAMCDQCVLLFYDFPFITVFQTTDLIKTIYRYGEWNVSVLRSLQHYFSCFVAVNFI